MASTLATNLLLTSLETTSSNESSFKLPFEYVTVASVAGFLIAFLIIGFFGNLLTICVIVTSTKLGCIFNQFILSLCFSDLLSASISWINLYRRTWGFNEFAPPNFFCWFYWGADICTSYVTAMHILSFSILRFLSVWKPFVFARIKIFHGRIWIGAMWFIGITCGFIPFAYMSGASVPDRSDLSSPKARWPSCTQNQETMTEYNEMILITYPLFLYAPCFGILLMSFAIAVVLMKKRMKKSRVRTASAAIDASKLEKEIKKERQAIFQLALIVGSFMIGYIPFTIFEFWTLSNTDKSYDGWKSEWLFGTVQYVFMRFSECLNPIFYNLASEKMRKETFKFVKRRLCCCYERRELKKRSMSTSVASVSGLQL